MKRAIAIALAAACSPTATIAPSDADTDAGDTTADAPVASTLTPECAANPVQCLYAPAPLPITTLVVTLHDTSRVGVTGTRDIPVVIRYAPTAQMPMPIVVWSHGGANGRTDASTVLPAWGEAVAAAGYFSVSIAHEPRDPAAVTKLCNVLGIAAGAPCDAFTYLDFDRPLDIAFAIETINDFATKPPFQGQIDPTQIAVAGHAGGAGAVFMVDGVARDVGTTHLVLSSAQPVAFVALSPPAAGTDGIAPDAFGVVTRPTLIATGRGDADANDTADQRAAVYDLLPAGDKARLFVEDASAVHTLFELVTDDCVATATADRCQQMTDWVKASVIAFLDAKVRRSPDAILWISSTDISAASATAAQWSTK